MKKENLKTISSSINNLVDKLYKIKYKKDKFIPGKTTIPSTGKVINSKEIKNMVAASLDGWLTSGRFNRKSCARE